MPQSLPNVVSHWDQLIEDFETSPGDFYSSLEGALERRQILGIKASRVNFTEQGALTPEREYLRVRRERLIFDVCAAPFGTGFFFSWWLVKRPPSGVLLYWLLFVGLVFLAIEGINRLLKGLSEPLTNAITSLSPTGVMLVAVLSWIAVVIVAILAVFTLFALMARTGTYGPEDAILLMPIMGTLYARIFAPITYYRIDTMLMFQSAVHAAVMEVVNSLLTAKGLRALNEAEQKPIMQHLVDKKHTLPGETLAAAR